MKTLLETQGWNRVVCGNALEVLKELPKESVNLVICDPPFYLPIREYATREMKKQRTLAEFSLLEPFFSNLFTECKRILKSNGHFFVFCDCISYPMFFVQAYGLWHNVRALIWYKGKNHFPIGTGQPFRHSYEMLLHAFNSKSYFTKENRQDVLTARVVPSGLRNHPAQKPLPLLMRIISACSKKNDVVVDPACGSGSTLVAAGHLQRKWFGVDLNPEYVEMSLRKLETVNNQTRFFEKGEANPP